MDPEVTVLLKMREKALRDEMKILSGIYTVSHGKPLRGFIGKVER